MHVVYSEAHRAHSPKLYFKAGSFHEHPEVVARADQIAATLESKDHTFVAPEDYGPGPRAAIHSQPYLSFMETVHARWQAEGMGNDEAVPNMHPGRHMAGFPDGLVGQIGWFTADLSTPIGPRSFEAAKTAANTAIHAARLVAIDGHAQAYALGRPPGHHCYTDMAGGFCLLNNIAIAVQNVLTHSDTRRALVLDVDVHHGNGTQGIFEESPEVMFVSSHQMPLYPGSGYPSETGVGNIVNMPLSPGDGGAAFRAAWSRQGLPAVERFQPDLVLVSAGFDAHTLDPLGQLQLEDDDYAWVTREIRSLADSACGGKLVSLLEGGYDLDALASASAAHVRALTQ